MDPRMAPANFDPHEVPLTGWTLVEASAGTGKTYALAGLYVRLLVERGLSTKEILVVTFTKAATDELKGRIRTRIKEALLAFTYGAGTDDFLAGLVSRATDHDRARRFLTDALRSFDEAAIFTIHGFCLRALHNHAFESGSLFDTELLEDETDMIKEMVHDFWRINFSGGSSQFFSCIRTWVNPEELLKLIRLCGRNPFLRVKGGGRAQKEIMPDAAEQACLAAFSDTAGSWPASRREILDILTQDAGLNRSIYTPKAVERLIEQLDAYFSSGYFLPSSDALPYVCFDPPVKRTALKKQAQPPAHPFFKKCEALRKRLADTTTCYDEKLADVRSELIDFVKRESSKRKLDRNVRTFNDLLLDLFEALEGVGGSGLAASLRRRYKAALIDEFQDTDPLQYAIFKKIYGYENATLFLIGDPKQAIFGFRGADVFAYIRASGDVAQHFTLDTNWRSSGPLIRAVNAIFDRPDAPFLLDALEYLPVMGRRTAPEELTFDGRPDPSPFKLWLLARKMEGKPLTRGSAREVLYKAVCFEIGRLLELGGRGKALIGSRPVGASDLAVIVRTNREAREVQSVLRQVNIPSVVYTGESVFGSDEALELEQIFQAVSDPTDEGRVKVALVTRMLGISGDALACMTDLHGQATGAVVARGNLSSEHGEREGEAPPVLLVEGATRAPVIADETEWEKWLTRFEEYRLLWLRSGFISMARKLVSREQIKPRLGALPDGERRLTNLLHLLELLHRVATQEKMGVEGLLKWLNERRHLVQDTAEEEHQIRLETDELAVKIVTIHKSKGLEYPITFCPFLWGDSRITQSVITYHDKEENYQSVVDVSMTPDETTIECAETEQLAENIRLTYVALTRAKYRCYAAWGYINNSETSALAYLLHGRTLSRCDLAALETHMKSLSDDALTGELRSLAGRSQGAIELLPVPEQTTPYYFGGPPIDSHGQVRGNLSSEHGEREGEAGYPRADGGSPAEEATRAPEIGLLRLRPFTGQIERDWRVSSFSALTSGKDEPAELPDRDSQVREEPPATGSVAQVEVSPGLSIFTFPAGAKAGSCLHEIFQYLDFARFESEEVRGLVTEKLARYGFAADWVDTVCLLIKNVLTAPLDDERSSTLSALGPDDRLREVEFHVPLELITPEGLGSFFASSEGRADPSLGGLTKRLGFKPVRGVLKGYIDLVFRRDHRYYIVDWKSNYLGASPEDYARERLMTVMEREFYTLQYHVYAVALHRFLELRLPDYDNEKHFGGVYYLFLRGMGPTGEYGVFFDRPAPERISALAHYLTGR